MGDNAAPGPSTQASAPQAPGRLGREDARNFGGGTLTNFAGVNARGGTWANVDELVGAHLLASSFHRHPARCLLICRDMLEVRMVVEAFLDPERAARMESAPRRRMQQVRRKALDRPQALMSKGIDA